MTIAVTQPDKEYASQNVRLTLDGKFAGVLHPGNTITLTTDAESCVIRADCGSYTCSREVRHDIALIIAWNPTAQKMELAISKK